MPARGRDGSWILQRLPRTRQRCFLPADFGYCAELSRAQAVRRGWDVEGPEDILVAVAEGGVATITLNRPAKRNAVSLTMWRRFADLLPELGQRNDVNVLILTGAGGHFCAGADISEFASVRADPASGRVYELANAAAILALRDCRKPTIAAVSGYGMGGGCALALACDLRVGDATTRMGVPAARLGVVYGELDCALLLRQLGLANAKRVLYTGRAFDAGECMAMGLVDILAVGQAVDAARDLAAQIAMNAPLSLAGSKLVLDALAEGAIAARRADIAAVMERAMLSADYREGARAFLEKRAPVFVGR
jgi:enoyl-CoA hydratase/carnithine racemase